MYCNRLAERLVWPFHGVTTYILQEMRVTVHSLRNGGVPKQRTHYLWVHTLPK
jgi:hypothetical protein